VTLGRVPSDRLAIDANIILSAFLGRGVRTLLDYIAEKRVIVTSVEVRREVLSTLRHLDVRPERLAAAEAFFATIGSLHTAEPPAVSHAAAVLTKAVPSRNGSPKDAHLLAVAWTHDADIWSHDRDFAGTGWPSWSSANLMAALSEPAVGQAS
jgi:predicted nucleic acid-binding protein